MHCYDIKTSEDFENAKVTVHGTLNRLASDSKLYLMYRNYQQTEQKWFIVEL